MRDLAAAGGLDRLYIHSQGMNNKIKVIKRMAYGYRDEHYFFLEIHAAFPGIPG